MSLTRRGFARLLLVAGAGAFVPARTFFLIGDPARRVLRLDNLSGPPVGNHFDQIVFDDLVDACSLDARLAAGNIDAARFSLLVPGGILTAHAKLGELYAARVYSNLKDFAALQGNRPPLARETQEGWRFTFQLTQTTEATA